MEEFKINNLTCFSYTQYFWIDYRLSLSLDSEIHKIILDLIRRKYTDQGRIYDLGCSTGTTIALINEQLSKQSKSAQFFGVDNSKAMIEKAGPVCRRRDP